MDAIEQFVKFYGVEGGKYEVGGERFRTKRRAKQFKSIFMRRCSVLVSFSYECCKDGESVYTADSKSIITTEFVRIDVSLTDWTFDTMKNVKDFITTEGNAKCRFICSSCVICNEDITEITSKEAKL